MSGRGRSGKGNGTAAHRLPYQTFMGTVFTGMGLATMALPNQVIKYCFTKEYLSDLPVDSSGNHIYPRSLILFAQCFGSQASLCGLLILTSKFRKSTYRYFGLAMIPYFIFDYYFWHTKALTTFGALGDGVGNVIFSICAYLGYSHKHVHSSASAKEDDEDGNADDHEE